MKEKYFTKEELEEKVNESWKRGYELGVSAMMRKNQEALKIGEAIMDVLDRRYEFKKEDY